MYTHTHERMHPNTHAQSPLPGHFALKRAGKLMRVQSFITLETDRAREGDGRRKGDRCEGRVRRERQTGKEGVREKKERVCE